MGKSKVLGADMEVFGEGGGKNQEGYMMSKNTHELLVVKLMLLRSSQICRICRCFSMRADKDCCAW